MRPKVQDVERFLDELEYERIYAKWLLEDLGNMEDSPETDAMIEHAVAHAK